MGVTPTLPRDAPLAVRDRSHSPGSGGGYGPPLENIWPRIAPSGNAAVWTFT